MAPRPFTPPELMTGPFHQRDALAAGLTLRQLRSRCWVRLFRCVYIHASIPLTDAVRFAALRLATPDDAIATGLTAAWLYGVWTPRPGSPVPLHVATPDTRSGLVIAGAQTSRLVVDLGDVDELHGVPITSPERTCFGLMTGSTVTEAVVWADAFLHADLVCTHGSLRYADERPHWPHVRKVRQAAGLARAGSASPMESRLRMVIVLAGLAEPDHLNQPVYGPDGSLLGIPDMNWITPWFGAEYDGSQHAEAEHHIGGPCPGEQAADNRKHALAPLFSPRCVRPTRTDRPRGRRDAGPCGVTRRRPHLLPACGRIEASR